MDVVLYEFLIDVPRAAAIWSALLVLALSVLTVLVARPERDPARLPAVPASAGSPAAAPTPRPDPADLRRYAEEVAVAATGAAQSARRRRADWLTAQEQVERAWQAYDEAETAARRFVGSAALPAPRAPRTPAEYAARERYLHRAAMAAYWQGDLSVRHLSDVFAHRHGWDPRLHPAEQEAVLHRVVRDLRRAEYRAVAERERVAWHHAEVAATAARSLAEEAYVAAERLRAAIRPAPVTPRLVPATARGAARWRPARVG
ncbi:hypothetical protein O7606_09865 [Micromonospora sp. WMMD882]|uniref:hypothetical protein n=1 Tax=Micromonospora sp. WMMD882 TaxID=3015151 RepID=UPI00248D06C2|nr:hypothetical protein [Micromonospora sp. WMMD882]WBB81637.1 hypothetical protein O7606_09865 [Micromonospora sp. WMMD882]